jgi:hypothetical protein
MMADTGNYAVYRHNSRAILAARRAGINIDIPKPRLPVTEQEETDTM